MPPPSLGLRHVALNIPDADYERCVDFYTRVVGMAVEWRPDDDSVYLSSGADNLALHRGEGGGRRLDHIGMTLAEAGHVDQWHEHMREAGVAIRKPPKTHRDGARSFYCEAPDGTVVQFIHHPPIADKL